jgi:hypothetical protein
MPILFTLVIHLQSTALKKAMVRAFYTGFYNRTDVCVKFSLFDRKHIFNSEY